MNAVDIIRRLHEHREWVNDKLLAIADKLSLDQLWQECNIGQGSIWRSLVHLYAAEYVWLETLLGVESPLAPGDLPGKLPGNQESEVPIASLGELKIKWSELTLRWQDYLQALPSESLDDLVYKVSSGLPGRRRATHRGDILIHVCLHAHYTSAQVVNMLRQVGADQLPDTMLITLARQQTAHSL